MNKKIMDEMKAELESLDSQSLLWNPRTLHGPSGARAKVDSKEVVMLCSNNYLGLANHRALRKAAIAAVKAYGAGSGSVRPIAGTMDLHTKLEEPSSSIPKTRCITIPDSQRTAAPCRRSSARGMW
jgi:glycine C-acetyltransferase